MNLIVYTSEHNGEKDLRIVVEKEGEILSQCTFCLSCLQKRKQVGEKFDVIFMERIEKTE